MSSEVDTDFYATLFSNYIVHEEKTYIDVYSTIGKAIGIYATLRIYSEKYRLVLLPKSVISIPLASQKLNKVDFFENLENTNQIKQISKRLFEVIDEIEIQSLYFAACICVGCPPAGSVHWWSTSPHQQIIQYKTGSIDSNILDALHDDSIPYYFATLIETLWKSPFYQIIQQIFKYWNKDLERHCNEYSVFQCIHELLPFTDCWENNVQSAVRKNKSSTLKFLIEQGYVAKKFWKYLKRSSVSLPSISPQNTKHDLEQTSNTSLVDAYETILKAKTVNKLVLAIHNFHETMESNASLLPKSKCCIQ